MTLYDVCLVYICNIRQVPVTLYGVLLVYLCNIRQVPVTLNSALIRTVEPLYKDHPWEGNTMDFVVTGGLK